MAPEQVCIILNEREPSKERLAQTLFEKLKSLGIATKRLSADPKLDKIIRQREAQIFVLDYIIGDYTTGLDLLNSMNAWEEQPSAIFLTDEPSLQVAVEAMKLGAIDYISTDSADALDRTVESIKRSLRKLPAKAKSIKERNLIKFNSITCNSPASTNALQEAKAIAAASVPLTIILGESGAGKSYWAEALMNQSKITGYYSRIDWRLCSKNAQQIFGLNLSDSNPHKFGVAKSLIIEEIESDSGDLFKTYKEFSSAQIPSAARLIVTTSCSKTAAMWQNSLGGKILKVPSLKDRAEDILELSKIFLESASESLGIKTFTLSKEHTSFISKKDWPGNLKQLKECLFEFALLTNSSEAEGLLAQAYENSLPQADIQEKNPGVLEAQITVDKFCGDYRLAAMHLGTSVSTLYHLLNHKSGGS